MLKLIVAVVMAALVMDASAYNIITNEDSVDYYYDCPYGYIPFDLGWYTRDHWTFTKWASTDHPFCALEDTYHPCFKPNGASKYWMTFVSGYATFKIEKWDYFSFSSGGSDYYTPTYTSAPMTQYVSNTLIPWYFSVRTFYFYVRGATEITILFNGPIKREIMITDAILDYRKITFIAIDWPEFPVIYNIEIIFIFPHRQKVKFWGLYVIACCEILTTDLSVGK